MIGRVLEEENYAIQNLDVLKKSEHLSPKIKSIINAIENIDNSFSDIAKKCSREELIYAIMLANCYQTYKLKKGYKDEFSKNCH